MSLGVTFERIRGGRDRFLFWASYRLRRIVSFALAFLGFSFAVAYPINDLVIGSLIGVVALGGFIASLFEVYTIVRDRRGTRLDAYGHQLYHKIHEKLPTTIYKNWSYLDNPHSPVPEAVIYLDALNARLDKMKNIYREKQRNFTIKDSTLRHYCPIIRRRIRGRTNEKKVRLCAELNESATDDQEIELQETSYFDSICTNEFSCKRLMKKGTHDRVILDGKTLFLDHENRLLDLSHSGCSNHIGVSTLVITCDAQIPIGKQTKGSLGSPGRWAPTGSGSVDYQDFVQLRQQPSAKFHDLITYAMERETQEESNLASEKMQTHIVGYAKLLHRGGKPDFFGISFSTAHSADVRIKGKEPLYMEDFVPHVASTRAITELEEHLRRIQEWYEGRSETSFILLLNLRFAADFLAHAQTDLLQPDS